MEDRFGWHPFTHKLRAYSPTTWGCVASTWLPTGTWIKLSNIWRNESHNAQQHLTTWFLQDPFHRSLQSSPPPRDGSWKWLTLHPDRPPHPWPCPPCPPKETGYKYRSVQKKHTVTFNIPYPIKTRSLSTDSYYIKMCTFQIIGADLPMVLNMVHPSAPNVRPLKRWRVAPGRPTCGDPKILKIRFCCWGRLRPQ